MESESAVEEGTAITDSVFKEEAVFGITAVRTLVSGEARSDYLKICLFHSTESKARSVLSWFPTGRS